MSNSHVAESLRSVLEGFLQAAQDEIARDIVEQETEGLTVEERLRLVEVRAVSTEADVKALAAVTREQLRELDQTIDNYISGTMSTIFEVIGHVLNRPFSVEEQDAIHSRAQALYSEAEANGENLNAAHIGRFVKQAVVEHLSK